MVKNTNGVRSLSLYASTAPENCPGENPEPAVWTFLIVVPPGLISGIPFPLVCGIHFAMPQPMSPPTDSPSDPPSIAELERLAAEHPGDASALVRLANAYWLDGRGSDVVGELAVRARTLDPSHRGAWHLWALAEPNPRDRVARWRQVTEHFPSDDLARAALADNAASLAGAEHDYEALDLAIATYEQLLQTAQLPEQRSALEQAVTTLKKWRF